MERKELVASICLVGAMFIWGTSFIAFKYALSAYSPLTVIAGRMIIASFIFLLLAKFLRGQSYRAGDWKYLLIMSFCEPCLYFILEAWALMNASASEAGVVTATLPLLVAILAAFVLKEAITRNQKVCIGITLVGVVWLTLASETSEASPNPMLGIFLEFLAMIAAAGYTITIKYISERYSALFLTAIQSFVGLIFFVPLAFIFESIPTEIDTVGISAIIYLGCIVTVFAYGFYNFSIRYLPAIRAVMFTNLIPVFTLVLAYFILTERIQTQQWLAAGLIIAGVVISQMSPKAKSAS